MRKPANKMVGIRRAAFALTVLSAAGGVAWAALATYTETMGAVTSGGGSASSATYLETQSAVGEVAVGTASSASYSEHAGVVQAWEPPHTAVGDWRQLEP